jgi:oligosaccharide repeat unit polymerase
MVIITLLYILVVGTYLLRMKRGSWKIPNPAIIFVLSQLVLFLGTIPYLDSAVEADYVYMVIMFGGMCIFVFGIISSNFLFRTSRSEIKNWLSVPFNKIESGFQFNFFLGIIIVVSVIVSFVYYYAVGYNILLEAVFSLFGDIGRVLGDDVVTLRLQSYSGDQYFAPGYVNQFKNVLLPLLSGYLIIRYILLRKRKDLFLFLILLPVNLVFLLGTGQRGPFFYIVVIFLIFCNISLPAKEARRINLISIVLLVILFSFATYTLQKDFEYFADINDFIRLLTALPERIFTGNQWSGVIGFRYIYALPTQYGREWFESFKILPGQGSKYTLASEVFKVMFGSYRGTAPVSIWGSIWFNFNWVGVAVIPFLMGMAYQGLYLRLIRGPKTLFRLLYYSAFSVILGMWIAGGPETLVNVGLLTIVILRVLEFVWDRMILKKKRTLSLTKAGYYSVMRDNNTRQGN